ncbi:MAG: putative membrane protein [Planctomycetota bacterium]|jgi:uncharacterized membrane protein
MGPLRFLDTEDLESLGVTKADRRARLFAILLGVGLAVSQTWRAATQSITHDEALNYLRYLSKPWETVFSTYTANHHFLFTYLAKFSTGLFGTSEFTMRLPSLIAFVLFALSIGSLTRRLSKSWLLFLASYSFFLLNPLLLDFLCAARGYGLALAFFTMALCLSHAATCARIQVPGRQRLGIGVVAALCLSSNLAFAPALVGLGCALLAIDLVNLKGVGLRGMMGCVKGWTISAILPAFVIVGSLILLPLRQAQRSHFFFGAESLRDTMRGLVQASYDHGGRATFAVDPTPLVEIVGDFVCPALLVVIVLSVVANWWRRKDDMPVLFGTSLIVAVFTVVVLHYVADAAYPMERTGLYLIPLFGLALVEAIGQFGKGRLRLATQSLLVLILLGSSAVFVTEFQVGFFRNWRYDAGTKRVVTRILEAREKNDQGKVRVALMDWRYGPSMAFYQQQAPKGAIAPISHKWTFGDFTFDYYLVPPVLATDDDESEYLRLFYKDPISKVVVGVNR